MTTARVRPYEGNPAYWQYRGEPILLLGGSDDDNLFQLPEMASAAATRERRGDGLAFDPASMNLEWQLDTLVAAGGNFVRCTMSCRDIGDVWPYARDDSTGLYDLDRSDDEFWRRLDRFLAMTSERGIIAQVEIWATYDFYQRQVRPGFFPWHANPYNPKNTSTWTVEQSGLPEHFPSDGCGAINPFFETVPALGNNELVLGYQKRYVDRLLQIAFGYDNVLYCVDNETNADPAWALFWADFVRQRARGAGVEIELTEMWDTFDPTDGAVVGVRRQPLDTNPYVVRSTPLNCLERPDLYSYSDISNTNAQRGETHYAAVRWFRERVATSGRVWPVHCDKMYGGDSGFDFAGTRTDGIERFWRNIFAGLAGCRFHRPPAGIGLDDDAQAHIRAMRMLTDELGVFACRPRPDLLSEREENTAFCLADAGRAYAIAFLNPGSCVLDTSGLADTPIRVRWLDVEAGAWLDPIVRDAAPAIRLAPPGQGMHAAIVYRAP